MNQKREDEGRGKSENEGERRGETKGELARNWEGTNICRKCVMGHASPGAVGASNE